MQVTNLKYYHNLPFEDYLNLPGVSYSTLKGFEGPPTKGMQLGSRVHKYINEPELFDWQNTEAVRKISRAIREVMGASMDFLEKEVAFTADFIHNGMVMQYKGRADRLKAGRIVVDFKVLSGYLSPAITMFGYDRQLSGYCLATGSPLSLIVSYNKISHKTETRLIKPDATFWEYQAVRRGAPQT